ncbi:MAG: dihydropteroate synthase [Verrucomicrobiales bacterium]|jgi:5-methyltetrahydrofolate--homocysteine methyltransferase|nr:dihydropteroate synthase [Verrucomicrobiales bacterium]
MTDHHIQIIGELMNNSYGRARKAWLARDVAGYQALAKLQTDLGAAYLTLNIDGTQKFSVTMQEMLDFLPAVIPAIQEVTDLPISFDNPHVAFHLGCLKYFDRAKSRGRPILNSLSVSRHHVGEMIRVVLEHDMNVIIMASECQRADGSHGTSTSVKDVVDTASHFVKLLHDSGDITNDRIIIDPGLAPIASDTSGLINLCLDSVRGLRAAPGLEGVHISVGLSNFSIGAPKPFHIPLEKAFLCLAVEAGMDFVLANPEKNTVPMPKDEKLVLSLRRILQEGRVQPGETQEDAGYRQLDTLMELWDDASALGVQS